MQLFDIWSFFMFMIAITAIVFVVVAVVFKMKIDLDGYKAKVEYYSDNMFSLIFQHSILWRLVAHWLHATMGVEALKGMRDYLANEIVIQHNIDLSGPKPKEEKFLFAYKLLDTLEMFFKDILYTPEATASEEDKRDENESEKPAKETYEN